MGLNSFITKLAKQSRKLDKQSHKEEVRERKAERKEETREKIREEKRYIRTKNLPPPYIGEIRYGYDIPHKRKDNFNKYVYKHCSETKKYEWVKID